MQSGIFPLKKIDTWEGRPIKSYPVLKIFIHEAYTRRLTAIQLSNMAGQQGYIQQNIYNILDDSNNNDTNNVNIVITQMAAATTTGGTLGSTYAPTTTASTIPAQVTQQPSTNCLPIKWPSCRKWWQCPSVPPHPLRHRHSPSHLFRM
jgi:hypothetical protein